MTRNGLPLTALCLSFCLFLANNAAAQTQDVANLAHPDVAERLSLVDTQRAAIQQQLQARAEALAAQPDPAVKETIKAEFATKILALLNDEQRAKFTTEPTPQKLMFQFREMKWDDVLDWFAGQQDLTLVMDQIPPGTFTYSDTRSYSPSEGIDLLNSVLMTRNFTLVRREKMLVVMALSDSIPLELLPRVTLDQLLKRGRFELVSVIFPLGGRPIDAVLQEVKPFLSNYGRAVPLAQGTQVLVVETAGKMQTINELIASVPLPKAAAKPDAVPAPKPIFASYPLGTLDAARTLETIKKLIPSEQITVDAKTAVLSAFLIPDQQLAIKEAIDVMHQSVSELPKFESVAYQLSGATAEEIKKQILSLAPNASVSSTIDRVLVIARSEDQQLVRSSLAAIDILPVEGSKATKVFEMEPTLAPLVETALKTFLPKGQIASNKAGNLVIRGNDEEIRIASEMVDVWKRSQSANQLKLRAFPLELQADAKWLATLTKVVPTANAWLADEGRQLMLLGSNSEITTVESMLPQLISLIQKVEPRKLQIYALTKNQIARRTSLTELPPSLLNIKMVDNKQELMVWASADQQVEFAKLLEELDHPMPTAAPTLPKTYPITVQDSALVLQILTAEFPEAKISVDTEGTLITALADEKIQAKITERIAIFNEQLPKKNVTTLETYSVRGMTAAALQVSLTPLLTKARVNVDATKNRLVINADAKTHQDISKMIKALGEKLDVDQQPVVVAYPIEHALPSQIKVVFDQLALTTPSVADDKLKQLVVTGTLETQAVAKATIAQIDRPNNSSGPKEIRSFEAKRLQAVYLLPTLQKLWPDLQLSVDAVTNRVIGSGSIKELDQLEQAMEKLLSSPDGKPQTVKTYPVPAGEMVTLATILGQIAPQAIISSDIVSRTVTVWANDEQHVRVQQALEQIGKAAQAAKVAATYTVKPTQTTAVQTSLLSLFPTAGVAAVPLSGQLIVVATPDQQQRISEVIEQLSSGPNSAERTIRVYKIDPERVDLTSLLGALQSTLPPQIRLESNLTNNTILAVGTVEELELVTAKIEELKQQLPAPESATSVIYQLKHGTTAGAIVLLTPLMPKATLVQDPTTRTIAVTAKAVDHRRIEDLLKMYDLPKTTANYNVKPTQVTMILTALRSLFPVAEMTADLTTGQLVVIASPDLQPRVAEVIELMAGGPNAAEKTIKVFRIEPERVDLTALLSALQSTLPSQIRLESSLLTNTIMAVGTPDELELVTTKIEELQKQIPAPELPTSVVYQLRHSTTAGAIIVLTPLVPKATLVQDPTSRTIAATAKAADHRKIAELIKLYDLPKATATYNVRLTQLVSVQTSLRTLFPVLEMAADATTGQLIVVATAEQQKQVKDIIELMLSGPNAAERTIKVFGIDQERIDQVALMSALQATLPSQIRLESSIPNGTIMAIGTPEDIATVADRIAKLEQELPKRDAKISEVYQLQHGNSLSALTILQSLFPRATIVQDPTSRTVAATATAHEHEKIREFITAFDQPKKSNRESKVYRLKETSAVGLATAITSLMPDAVVYGSLDGVLVATATGEQHKRIEAIVRDYDVNIQNSETRVFALGKGNSTTLKTALQGFSIKATATADIATNSLIVTAPATEMERIAQIVKEVETAGGNSKTSKFYPLLTAQPLPLSTALQASFLKATFSADTTNGGVFATATEEDQVEIAKVIDEVNAQPTKLPTLKAFVLKHANPATVAEALKAAFGLRSTAGVSFSRDTKSVLVVSTQQELLVAAQIVEQFDSPKSTSDSKRLQLFPLSGVDGKAISTSLESLFKDDQSSVDIRYDPLNEQLFVTGTSNQLKLVEDAIKQFAPPERELEIIQLNSADPMSFKLAAEALFQDEPTNSAPTISVDTNQQQVLIRATKEQLESIRKLLQKMGETQTSNKPLGMSRNATKNGETGTGRLRFVPVHRNSKQLLEDVRQMWPKMRNNPLNIVTPNSLDGEKPAAPVAPQKPDELGVDNSTPRTTWLTSARTKQDAQQPETNTPPVIVVTGEDQWTIASEDTEALDLFAQLVDTLVNPKVAAFATAGNFSVYLLRHADAKHLQEVLSDLFRSGDSNRRSTFSEVMQRVKIVADARINALIIGGNRADRKIVEELLTVFDSKELLDTLQQITPSIVHLESASAKNVVDIIKEVYKSQLKTGAGRDPITIPEGVSTEVATMLQQINAQSSSPLLTVAVEEVTNAIVLRGPTDLLDEVEVFIRKLDQQTSTTSARRVQLLRLESTNTKNLEKALNLLRSK